MTTEQTTPDPVIEPAEPDVSRETPPEASTPPETNADLRAYADRVKAENQLLRKELMAERLGQIGLTDESGLGKAIAKEYVGEMTLEAIRAYAATEYQHESGELPNPAAHLGATERAGALDSANVGTVPPKAPDQGDKIDKAQEALLAEGAGPKEAKAAIAAKLEGFVEQNL